MSILTSTRTRLTTYWITTALVAFSLGLGGVGDVLRMKPVVEGMAILGYPAYFCVILGIWKLLGTVTILAPGLPRLKEWAYAGIVFDFTGAAASHFVVGDSMGVMVAALVLTGLAFASWSLRPSSRRLDGPIW